jgi:hypothetical protein
LRKTFSLVFTAALAPAPSAVVLRPSEPGDRRVTTCTLRDPRSRAQRAKPHVAIVLQIE